MDDEMPLREALHILARVHTNDDDQVGFHVRMGVATVGFEYGSMCAHDQYVEAWRVVRKHLNMQVDPQRKTDR